MHDSKYVEIRQLFPANYTCHMVNVLNTYPFLLAPKQISNHRLVNKIIIAPEAIGLI